jgi:hypothetical protein
MYPGPVPVTPEVRDKLAILSVDEPLPETYGRDTIRFLIQSPRRVFAYWEFARDPNEALNRLFGGGSQNFFLAIRLLDLDSGHVSVFPAPPSRNYWFDVVPGRRYMVEVGFQGMGGAFIRLFSSEVIETPRGRVSSHVDPSPEFSVSPDAFAQVLERAGYVADAVEVALEAADEASRAHATRELAARILGEDVPEMSEAEMSELRAAIAAFAFGASLDEVAEQVSERFARWLLEHFGAHEFSSELVLRLLRELLGISFELSAEGLEAARRQMLAARVVVGASEINMPGLPIKMWIPSMTAGVRAKLL